MVGRLPSPGNTTACNPRKTSPGTTAAYISSGRMDERLSKSEHLETRRDCQLCHQIEAGPCRKLRRNGGVQPTTLKLKISDWGQCRGSRHGRTARVRLGRLRHRRLRVCLRDTEQSNRAHDADNHVVREDSHCNRFARLPACPPIAILTSAKRLRPRPSGGRVSETRRRCLEWRDETWFARPLGDNLFAEG